MPRERSRQIRPSKILDAEKFFIIASEGEVTERKYFNQLSDSDIFNKEGKIEVCHIQRPSGDGNPIALRTQIREIKRDVNYRSSDELWIIMDVDNWQHLLEKHGYTFDSFIEACETEDGAKVLVSNPCFEMWLILHLRKLSELTNEQQEKLLLNEKEDGKPYAKRLFAEITPGNRGYSGKPKASIFIPHVYEAIANAKEISVSRDKYPKALGSDVYKIVERLVKKRK